MSATRSGPGHEHDHPVTRAASERLTTTMHGRAGTGQTSGSVLIAVAAWLLALTGAGALFVSFTAQYTYIRAVRHQDAASVIEALLVDLLMIVLTLLALGLSRAGQSAAALSRIAAQHDEITRLRRDTSPASTRRLPTPSHHHDPPKTP
jgi:hypothetical protein